MNITRIRQLMERYDLSYEDAEDMLACEADAAHDRLKDEDMERKYEQTQRLDKSNSPA